MILAVPPAVIAPACEARILHYADWREASEQKWSFSASSADGSTISILGAQHLRDPAEAQFREIASAFARTRPTAVFFEGPNRGVATSGDEAIRTQGESGYVRFLASKAGLTAQSLEPSPRELMASMIGSFDPDSIMLFFVAREATRLRDREKLSGSALDSAVATLLTKARPIAASAGLKTGITDLASLSGAVQEHWPGLDWQQMPSAWFAPGKGSPEAKFLPAINTAVSEARNVHMVRLFSAAAVNGGRVFVVVGRNHVPMIAPALACALRR